MDDDDGTDSAPQKTGIYALWTSSSEESLSQKSEALDRVHISNWK